MRVFGQFDDFDIVIKEFIFSKIKLFIIFFFIYTVNGISSKYE
jgi:hypothetical protein